MAPLTINPGEDLLEHGGPGSGGLNLPPELDSFTLGFT